MEKNDEKIVSEEEYFREKQLRKILLVIFPILLIPGLFSLGVFLFSLAWPEEYVLNPDSALLKLTVSAFIPVILISFFGLVIFFLSLKRSFLQLKISVVILLVASTSFIPYTIEYYATMIENIPINYSVLSDEELSELVTEDHDMTAANFLKIREQEKEKAYYEKLQNNQLYTHWKINGDLKAYDEFNRRMMKYRVERIKYSQLTGTELLKKYQEEGDQIAWFEIESRKSKIDTGEGLFD